MYGYTDLDWVGSAIDRKNTSGGCYCLGSTTISWFSKKISSVSLITVEADYIASCSASCEAIWRWKLISTHRKPVFHDKYKHIEKQYFYIRDMVQKGAIKLQYVSTNEKVVYMLTKPLSQVKFEYFYHKLGVVRKDFPREEQWLYYRLFSQGGTMMILQTFLTRKNDEDMDSLCKGGTS